MYLNVNNIVFIILSYQFLTTPTGATNYTEFDGTKGHEDLSDCYIPIPNSNDLKSPTPYKLTHHTSYNTYNTDWGQHGPLHLKHNADFKLECSAGRKLTIGKNLNKIIVKCVTKETLEVNGTSYKYSDIKCNEVVVRKSSIKINDKRTSYEIGILETDTGPTDCSVLVPNRDYDFMPVPFLVNISSPAIIHPNKYGFFNIKVNDEFKLSCTNSIFVEPVTDIDEITVKCISKTLLDFNGTQYHFTNFKCKSMPQSTMVLTRETCQNEVNRVMEIGFQTNHVFLVLYKICFDIMRYHPIYSWYHTFTPQPKLRQLTNAKPKYINTKTFGKKDVNAVYWNQEITLDRILRSKERVKEIIIRGDKRYVTKVHLMAKSEFYYAFEKHATYYLENTTPQWYRYSKGFWRDMERVFRRFLCMENSKNVVVSGTFMTSTIPDKTGVPHPFYLTVTRQIPVPQYVWKMNYNVINKTGVVWVGLNNPTTRLNETKFLCNTIPCPTRMIRKSYSPKLMYCCTKDSFEREYGKIDPIVFKEFNLIEPQNL